MQSEKVIILAVSCLQMYFIIKQGLMLFVPAAVFLFTSEVAR